MFDEDDNFDIDLYNDWVDAAHEMVLEASEYYAEYE